MVIIRRIPSSLPEVPPKDSVYQDAREVHDVARRHGIATRPFDIEKFIRMHNITVVREEMSDNDISGYIECRVGDRWVIGINKYHNVQRQRFTLAHEFAHFCLHRETISDQKIEEVIIFRDATRSRKEQDANEFASQILIPDKSFATFVKERTKDIAELAELFGVSPAAIRYKAYKLKFIREY